jgi:phage tail-like protein
MPDPKPADTPPGPSGGAVGQRPEPLRSYNFSLEIDAKNEGYFTHCSGLGMRVNHIAYREGGGGLTVHRLSGPVEYGEVVLKYGLTQSRTLWDWLMSAASGAPQRKNVSILMQKPDGTGEDVRWNLIDAWACEWRGAPLEGLGREIAIETLVLVCEKIERG